MHSAGPISEPHSFLQSLRGPDRHSACCPETLSVLIKQNHQHIELRLQALQEWSEKTVLNLPPGILWQGYCCFTQHCKSHHTVQRAW